MLGQWCAVMLALGARWLGHIPYAFIPNIVLGMLLIGGGFDLLIILKIKGQLVEALGFGAEPCLTMPV